MPRDRNGFRGTFTRGMSQAAPPSGPPDRSRLAAVGIGTALLAICILAIDSGSDFMVPQDYGAPATPAR